MQVKALLLGILILGTITPLPGQTLEARPALNQEATFQGEFATIITPF